MKHPLFSLGDGTEVTASSMKDGQVHVYTERWSDEKDMFLHADIVIPGAVVISSEGYSDEEIRKMQDHYTKLQNDIIEYVTEKETISA